MSYLGAGITRFNTADDLTVTDDAEIQDDASVGGDLTVTGTTTLNGAVNGVDKIEEGNSSVEVVDTGTGHVAVTVDGSETARFSEGTPLKITKSNSNGNALEIVNNGNSRSVDINHNADNTGIVDDIVRIKNNGTVVYELEADGNLKFNSGYGSAATAYGCRAWVNFDGTGTPSIRDSGNVSSITDVSTGRYEVNFSNAMPDGNYSAVASGRITSMGTANGGVITTTKVRVEAFDGNGTLTDTNTVCVAIFR